MARFCAISAQRSPLTVTPLGLVGPLSRQLLPFIAQLAGGGALLFLLLQVLRLEPAEQPMEVRMLVEVRLDESGHLLERAQLTG